MAKKSMRLPNGFGSITKVSGRRRKPFQAKTPTLGYHENGVQIVKSLGYYETYNEAYERLLTFHKEAMVVEETEITFKETYDKALAEKVASAKSLTEGTINVYNAAFGKLKPLYHIKMKDIRLAHLQKVVDDNQHLSHSVLSTIKLIYGMIFKYALKYDVAQKDYSQFVELRKAMPATDKEKYFTDDERRVIIEHADEEAAQRLLVMIYSGFRVSAYDTLEMNFDEMYFKGGVKTAQSKDRIVPINSHIVEYARNWRRIPFDTHTRMICEFEDKYGLRHLTSHACRHTFSYLLDKAKVDGVTSRMLMGHTLGKDSHDKVYSHRSIDELREAVESLDW